MDSVYFFLNINMKWISWNSVQMSFRPCCYINPLVYYCQDYFSCKNKFLHLFIKKQTVTFFWCWNCWNYQWICVDNKDFLANWSMQEMLCISFSYINDVLNQKSRRACSWSNQRFSPNLLWRNETWSMLYKNIWKL